MRPISRAGRTDTAPRGRDEGYTYITILVVMVAAALAAQTAWIPTGTEARRAAEAELLFRGQAYASAIESYYQADSPGTYPGSLADLLEDPRSEGRRHIRRLYPPVFSEEWQLLPAADGGIAGVAIASDKVPFKRSGFSAKLAGFENAETYADWEFYAQP